MPSVHTFRSMVGLTAPVLGLVGPYWACATDRAAIPDAKDRAAAVKVVDEVVHDEGKMDGPKQLAFAKKLLDTATGGNDSAALQYVELCRARDLAAGNDLELAFNAVKELDRRFRIDPLQMKFELLTPKTTQAAAIQPILSLSMDATDSGRFDIARRAADFAINLAERCNNSVAVLIGRQQKNLITKKEKDAHLIENAKARLANDPEDIEASMTIGRILCIEDDAWDQGLWFIAKTPDPKLLRAVQLELRKPADAVGLLAVADAWWEASSLPSTSRWLPIAAARAHAVNGYCKLLPTLSGIQRIRVEKRLVEATLSDRGDAFSYPDMWTTFRWVSPKWELSTTHVVIDRSTEGIRITNRDQTNATSFVGYNFPVDGDFAALIDVQGGCSVVLLAADMLDDFGVVVPDDGARHEVVLQRKAQSVAAAIDGKPAEVRYQKSAPATIAGWLGLMIDEGKSVEASPSRQVRSAFADAATQVSASYAPSRLTAQG